MCTAPRRTSFEFGLIFFKKKLYIYNNNNFNKIDHLKFLCHLYQTKIKFASPPQQNNCILNSVFVVFGDLVKDLLSVSRIKFTGKFFLLKLRFSKFWSWCLEKNCQIDWAHNIIQAKDLFDL